MWAQWRNCSGKRVRRSGWPRRTRAAVSFFRSPRRVDTDLAFRVIATPGHSAGSVCLLCGGLLFSGDTLFAGDVGRTDLPGGSWDTLRESLKKLCAAVTENVQVLPGHEEFSTMDRERANNRYLQF